MCILLDYNYIKNHYRLIATSLRRTKELDADPKAIQQKKIFGQLKKLNSYGNNDESLFILTISEKIREARLKFSQGNVTVL